MRTSSQASLSALTNASPAQSQSPAPPHSTTPTGNSASAPVAPGAPSALGFASPLVASGGSSPSGPVPVSSMLQARQRLESDRIVFRIYKGVKTFTFSEAKNLLVTGGMDRIVRFDSCYIIFRCTVQYQMDVDCCMVS